MDTALYYFSGTGNSLSVARTINEHLHGSKIFPLIGSLKQIPVEVNAIRVGIIFPIHYMSVPGIVRDFLMQVKFNNSKYIFVVVTGAYPKFGNAISEVDKLLQKVNLKLNSAFFVPMVAAHFPYIKVSKVKPHNEINSEAIQKVLHICESVSNLKHEFDYEYTIIGNIKQLVSNKAKGNKFSVGEGCIRCGYCMHVCPFQNIRLKGRNVQWLNNCHRCFACLHYCSQGVIEYKKLSVGKPRYHHPSVSLNDISQQRG